MTINEKAFLYMIAWSELGQELIDLSDDGYNVLVGSTPEKPILFTDYSDHPRKLMHLKIKSAAGPVQLVPTTAAGRYQILMRIFDHYKKQFNLKDFGKASQDKIAMQLIRERHALKDIEEGYIERAIYKCASAWASFPRAGYGQHEQSIEDLLDVYARKMTDFKLSREAL